MSSRKGELSPQEAAAIASGVYDVMSQPIEGDPTNNVAPLSLGFTEARAAGLTDQGQIGAPVMPRSSSGLMAAELHEIHHETVFSVPGNEVIRASSGFGRHRTETGFGYVAEGQYEREGEGLIAIRGTVSGKDWMTDFDTMPVTSRSGMTVHRGFHTIASSATVLPRVEERVREISERRPSRKLTSLHIVGHSLGGAVATLIADHLASHGRRQGIVHPETTIRLYTFGSPRAGFSPFAEHLTRTIGADNIYRVYLNADPVSMVPCYPFAPVPDSNGGLCLQAKLVQISDVFHKMGAYRETIGNRSWPELKDAALTDIQNDLAEARRWLLGSVVTPVLGPLMFSAGLLNLITAAINYIMDKAGMRTGGCYPSATLLDQVAWTLWKLISLPIELGFLAVRTVKMIFAFLGRVIPPLVELTAAFIRWILDLLVTSVTGMAKRAIGLFS